MRYEFARDVLVSLLKTETLDRRDSLLAVCSGDAELRLFTELQFSDTRLSDISSGEDAQALPYDAGSVDFAFVSDGLHHCRSPHQALLEMYRVARKGVIVVESRDSAAVRLAARLGLTSNYELSAVRAHGGTRGGMDDTAVPNHVYRWTEREFEKTLRSFDPTGQIQFRYFYAVSLPYDRLGNPRWLRLAQPIAKLAGTLFRRQSNSFAMVGLKPDALWPWLETRDGATRFVN